MMRILIAVLLLLLLTTGMAFGQIYKWVDVNGDTHYSDRPPTGNFKTEAKLRSNGVTESSGGTSKTGSTAAKSKSLAEQEAEFRKRRIEKEEADKKNQKKLAAAANRSRNCEAARSYLKALQTGQRVAHTDPDTGQRSYLDDSQRAAETVRAQKEVTSWCSDSQ